MAARRGPARAVIAGRFVAWTLFGVAVATGTLSDRVEPRAPIWIGGYRVLAADFHVHCGFPGGAALAPWDLVFEARRRGLDAFALTPHNTVFGGRIGRLVARRVGGPTVLAGEEIRTSTYHLMAIGVERSTSPRLPAASAIAEVHRQGGVAIAAHPNAAFWPAYDAESMAALDGSEVCHPGGIFRERKAAEMRLFYERVRHAAIGSSDYHGLGWMGMCRTYVFAADDSEAAIVDAIRAGRTVVYDREGRAFGDAELIGAAAADGRLPEPDRSWSDPGALARFSRALGILALAWIILAGLPRAA